jgi:glycosyltransferase involved in cell wall biosynthesis
MNSNEETIPIVSLVICTRNRGELIQKTLESAFRQDYPNFEIVVVDQSDTTDTYHAVCQYIEEPCFKYIPSRTKGLSSARNIGMQNAAGDIVAYTDDDCYMPADWLSKMKQGFDKDPQICIEFCNVKAGSYDTSSGFIPEYNRTGELILKSTKDKLQARGIGAGMAVRKSTVQSLGSFDEWLGAGGHFPSCEDGDMALRAILAGYYVLETDSTYVVHEGYRTWQQGKQLARRNWVGIGAAYVKPLRCGRWDALNVVLYESVDMALGNAFRAMLRIGRPQGIRDFFYFWEGFFKGLVFPLDKASMLYRGHSNQ